jgi:hypothetical protein
MLNPFTELDITVKEEDAVAGAPGLPDIPGIDVANVALPGAETSISFDTVNVTVNALEDVNASTITGSKKKQATASNNKDDNVNLKTFFNILFF